jgi:restriction system protein
MAGNSHCSLIYPLVDRVAEQAGNTFMGGKCSEAVDFVDLFPPLDHITPNEFELLVKSWFATVGQTMEYFEVGHLETLPGTDGEYTFDVTVRFRAFQGAQFLVLVECKKHKNPVKREVIQILHDRLRSVGGHKGFVIATTQFQRGAIEYAQKHGIALVQVVPGGVMYIRASADQRHLPRPSDIPRFVGCHFSLTPKRQLEFEFVGRDNTSSLESLLCLCESAESP